MLKRFFLTLALVLGIASPAMSAGTISFSLSQQFDNLGKPLSGCKLYFYQAGTVATPQNAYQDTNLTIPQPNPMTCDAAGRLGQFFLADGQIKIRLTNASLVDQVVADNILVIGPSSGGGGGGSVDPTTVLSTGDMKVVYGTGSLAGFVRANGRTIGSATSGATERANADVQALFVYLWGADPNLAVSGGRGASAAADWAANKTIALPDWRGRALTGLDDMGNTAAGVLTSTFCGNPTSLGSPCGGQSHVQTIAEMPSHFHAAGIFDPGHQHGYNPSNASAFNVTGGGNIALPIADTSGSTTVSSTGVRVTSTNGIDSTYSTGGGNPMATLSPIKLATIYLKL